MKEMNEKEMEKVTGGVEINDWPKCFEDGARVIVYEEDGKFYGEIARGVIVRHVRFDMYHDFEWLCEVRTDSGETIEAYEVNMELC